MICSARYGKYWPFAFISNKRITEVTSSTSGLVCVGVGDRLRVGKPPLYVTSHPGQLSLLPSVGREMMSTGEVR